MAEIQGDQRSRLQICDLSVDTIPARLLELLLTMARTATLTKQRVGIPVYALDWLDNVTVVAAGGGGAGKFGVANKIVRSCICIL